MILYCDPLIVFSWITPLFFDFRIRGRNRACSTSRHAAVPPMMHQDTKLLPSHIACAVSTSYNTSTATITPNKREQHLGAPSKVAPNNPILMSLPSPPPTTSIIIFMQSDFGGARCLCQQDAERNSELLGLRRRRQWRGGMEGGKEAGSRQTGASALGMAVGGGVGWRGDMGSSWSVTTMRTCLRGLALHSDTGSTPPAGRSPSARPLKGVWEQDPSQGSEVGCMS